MKVIVAAEVPEATPEWLWTSCARDYCTHCLSPWLTSSPSDYICQRWDKLLSSTKCVTAEEWWPSVGLHERSSESKVEEFTASGERKGSKRSPAPLQVFWLADGMQLLKTQSPNSSLYAKSGAWVENSGLKSEKSDAVWPSGYDDSVADELCPTESPSSEPGR